MGQDMYHYAREVAIKAEPYLVDALKKARARIASLIDRRAALDFSSLADDEALLKEIDHALAQARIE
jgi:hypothetical protein